MIDSLLFPRYCRFRCLSILCFFKEITVNITHFETCKDYWHCNETKFRGIYLGSRENSGIFLGNFLDI